MVRRERVSDARKVFRVGAGKARLITCPKHVVRPLLQVFRSATIADIMRAFALAGSIAAGAVDLWVGSG